MNFSFLPVPNSSARLLLSSCISSYTDLEIYRNEGARLLITLISDEELRHLRVADLAKQWNGAWLQLPIPDFGVPNPDFEKKWLLAHKDIHTRLDKGESLALHCRAGLGRTGTIAAKILIERGISAGEAIDIVRHFRVGAIETKGQEEYLQGLKS